MKTDKKVSHIIADVVVIDRDEKMWYFMDFAIPMNLIMLKKKRTGRLMYIDLTAEVRRQFTVKAVILPIVVGALGTVPIKLSESLEKLEIKDVIESLQTAVLFDIHYSYTAILRSV